jgi:phosphoglycolate phosphatase
VNVLFDLDGTLTDPREGILACFKHALEKLQVAAPTDRELEGFIGPPLWESFSTLCGSSDKGVVEQAVALYRERFATKGMFENRIYSGIADALASLQLARVQLFVVTSKALLFAEPIVEHFGLRRLFRSVYGSELDGSYADKSELIAKVLCSESLTPDGSRDELVSAGADLLCKTPNKLVETVCFR